MRRCQPARCKALCNCTRALPYRFWRGARPFGEVHDPANAIDGNVRFFATRAKSPANPVLLVSCKALLLAAQKASAERHAEADGANRRWVAGSDQLWSQAGVTAPAAHSPLKSGFWHARQISHQLMIKNKIGALSGDVCCDNCHMAENV